MAMTALIDVPIVLVLHPPVSAKTLREMSTSPGRTPGELNYGAPGVAFWECR
jgi:hypothetical protein